MYPSCGFDASPARVFPNVTFVDAEKGNEGCVQLLQEAGLKAIKTDIREYHPAEEHDLLILLNPAIPAEWATCHLSTGGYIIANDYHGSASQLAQKPDQFLLFGSIDLVNMPGQNKDGKAIISRNIEGLFEQVSSPEEFRRLRPDAFEFKAGLINSMAERGIIDASPSD